MPAGLLLAALLVIKPFVIFMVVPALFLAGERRAFLVCVAAAGAMTLISALQLGSAGVHQYLDTSSLSTRQATSTTATLRELFGIGWPGFLAELAAAAVVLAAVWRRRREGAGLALSAGVLGSFLASPYLHTYDMPMLVVAAWIALAEEQSIPTGGMNAAPTTLFLVGAAAGELVWFVGPVPFLIFELGWLALLFRPRTRDSRTS